MRNGCAAHLHWMCRRHAGGHCLHAAAAETRQRLPPRLSSSTHCSKQKHFSIKKMEQGFHVLAVKIEYQACPVSASAQERSAEITTTLHKHCERSRRLDEGAMLCCVISLIMLHMELGCYSVEKSWQCWNLSLQSLRLKLSLDSLRLLNGHRGCQCRIVEANVIYLILSECM